MRPARFDPHGNWFDHRLERGSVDVVIGDGCFLSTRYPGGYAALSRSLRSALDDRGMLAMRFFCAPEVPETVAGIAAELQAGRTGSFNAFRMRLAAAVQRQDSRGGVALGEVHRAWEALGLKAEELSLRTGWSLEEIRTIDLYRGRQARFHFATLAEVRGVLQDDFSETETVFPGYEMGRCCPILVLRPRAGF